MKTAINPILSAKPISALIAGILLLFAGASFAQERENVSNSPSEEFAKWDLNSDGLMNPGEFGDFIGDVGLRGDWDRFYDGPYDDDGLYTGFLEAWDVNADSLISREEYATGNTEWEKEYRDNFDNWDTDDNNVLDMEEYANTMNQTGVFAGWEPEKGDFDDESELHSGIFESYDTDMDGYISEGEFIESGIATDLED